MNRRSFCAAALSSAAFIVGCDTEQKPAPTATLTNNGAIQDAMKHLADAISDLQNEVGDFEDTNWREVVPNVETATANVDDAFSELRSALMVPNS